MAKSTFVYVAYIRTTPAKLWQALTKPEFTRRYWWATWQDCKWKRGAPWRLMFSDGTVADTGKVLEIKPQRKLVLAWRHEFKPALRAEGYSRMTYDIKKEGKLVKLTVLHEMNKPNSKVIKAVSWGWPGVISSLKSLLETGKALDQTKG